MQSLALQHYSKLECTYKQPTFGMILNNCIEIANLI